MRARGTGNASRKTTWLRRLLLVIISLVIGVNLYLWNAQSVLNNTLPMPFGYGFAVVMSGSMEPALRVDDLVVIHAREEYRVGDIIVFQSGNERIIHRIVAIDGETVQTKGDANNVPDAPVALSEVKGTLVLRLPGAGVIARALRNPLGIVIVLAVAFVLLEMSYRKQREEKDENQERLKDEIRRLQKEICDSQE